MDFNPWQVENIEVFNYYCCPECVYRAKEEFDFQVHAIQNHVQSRTLFNHEQQPKYENPDEASVEVKVELVENDSMAIDEFDEKDENSDIVQNTVKSRTLRFHIESIFKNIFNVSKCLNDLQFFYCFKVGFHVSLYLWTMS